jgi:hypothetical protein
MRFGTAWIPDPAQSVAGEAPATTHSLYVAFAATSAVASTSKLVAALPMVTAWAGELTTVPRANTAPATMSFCPR